MHLAFICTANMCRSIMAHAILESIVRSDGLDIEVSSAGVMDFGGMPPAKNAWLTCLHNDTAVTKKASTFVGALDLDTIDLFLVMEEKHRNRLMAMHGIDAGRIRLLGSYDDTCEKPEIADPINKPKTEFQACHDRLTRCIRHLVDDLAGQGDRSENSSPGSG